MTCKESLTETYNKTRTTSLIETYKKHFKAEPEILCHAPGRVNIIGDHTDYNDGYVLPAAINLRTDIAASARNDKTVRALAIDCNNETIEFSLNDIQFNQDKMWVNYIGGTLLALMQTYPDINGADFVITGDVPLGAGLSSSASLEIAILRAFAKLHNLPLDGVNAALMGQKAENEFVGCNCGIMDQLISACGKKNQALLLDCGTLQYQYAPIPEGLSLLIVNSNVKRGLVDSEYNSRREQCETVANHFAVKALCDISIEQLESAKSELSDVSFRRARHVITESRRTEKALTALKNNDMTTMSLLMKYSHNSLRDDFEVTTPETDYLVEIIAKELGTKGGARMTGGGFGGCVVALVPDELVNIVSKTIELNYEKETGLAPSIYICTAEQGAFV